MCMHIAACIPQCACCGSGTNLSSCGSICITHAHRQSLAEPDVFAEPDVMNTSDCTSFEATLHHFTITRFSCEQIGTSNAEANAEAMHVDVKGLDEQGRPPGCCTLHSLTSNFNTRALGKLARQPLLSHPCRHCHCPTLLIISH
jgi:hypothetical protein